MRAFAQVAERFGGVDSKDEQQVERFFSERASALPEREQVEILEALLELEGTDLKPLKARKSSSRLPEILLKDSPPLAVPETQAGSRIGETARRGA
jgi:hypothetical protein